MSDKISPNGACVSELNRTEVLRLVESFARWALLLVVSVALLTMASCSPTSEVEDQVESGQSGERWSNPVTWAGSVPPQDGDSVFISEGQTVVLDGSTAALDCLRIAGTLIADPAVDVGVIANCIEVMQGGTLQIGSESEPYERSATITLTGPRGAHQSRNEDNGLDNDGVQRALRVMDGGSLKLFGATAQRMQTKLASHADAGSTSLALADSVYWRAGDRIAVSVTDFFGVGETEVLTLADDTAGPVINLTSELQTFRWGLLQYPTDITVAGNAVSLTPGAFTPASSTTATVLDERAQVVNLSRRIVIQGANDDDWNNEGFGAHVMVMGSQSVAQVRGVELRRGGQRRAMGRYPFHWHMLSYTSADGNGAGGGEYLGDVDPQDHFLEDSSVWDSENRAVTIHATCGVNVDNVYAVDVKGHAFFLEDGSEQRNHIENCIAMQARDPGSAERIKMHDRFASGFWLTNPDNTIVNNVGSDCSGRGLWNSYASRCFGQSRNAPVEPVYIVVRQFDDNTGHSNRFQGIMTDDVVVDEAGNTAGLRYLERYGVQQEYVFFMRRNKVWKNSEGGYQNRVMKAQYIDWVAADNDGRDFKGSTLGPGLMSGTLLIAASLNNATAPSEVRCTGLASYHYHLDIVDVTAVNYPYHGPTITANGQFVYGGGVFDSSDLYSESIGMGGARNSGWRFINSDAGYLTPPPYFDGFPLSVGGGEFRYWSLPGAIWDPYGYWGPAENYLVVDDPFYTYGLPSGQLVSPGQTHVSTSHVFYGIDDIRVDAPPSQGSLSLIPLRLGRLNATDVEVGEHTIGPPSQSAFLPNMRSFSVAKNGRYKLTFPGVNLPSSELRFRIHNGYRQTDTFLICVPWSGSTPVGGRVESGSNVNQSTGVAEGVMRVLLRTGNSVADVQADPTGSVIWQDTVNNEVWIKHVGGLVWEMAAGDPMSDRNLVREQNVYLVASQ
jgi:hypothetical protein